jgi:hypothetical protein
VVLPLSLPGVISGITMVFMPAVTTFAISRLLGSGNFWLFRRHHRAPVPGGQRLELRLGAVAGEEAIITRRSAF